MVKRKSKVKSRTRTPSYAALKRILDRVFSEFVRRNNVDRNGNVSCYTCQRVMPWRSTHAGHWIPRHRLSTRWHEANVKTQCPACNLYRRGQPHIFARNLMIEYGPEIIDKLISLSRQTTKLSRTDLQTMIENYSAKVEALG